METDHLILRETVLRTVTVPEQEANLKYLEGLAESQAASAGASATAASTAKTAAESARDAANASKIDAAQSKSDAASSATQAVAAKQIAVDIANQVTDLGTGVATAVAAAATATTKAAQTTADAASANASAAAANQSQIAAGVSEAASQAYRDFAQDQAIAATEAAVDASTSAASASLSLAAATNRYYGDRTVDPVARPDGSAMVAGDRYYSTTTGAEKVYSGSTWGIPNVGAADLANQLDSNKGSALVGILLPETGAVGRTLLAKLRDGFVSVKDFGATGDGVTDDTAAIQKALNTTGKRILMPPGTYLVAGTLTRTSPLVLEGVLATIVVKNTQSSNGLAVSNANVVSISGVNFSSTRASGIYTQALTLTNCDNISLRDMTIRGMTQFSIQLKWTVAGTYESVLLDNVHVLDAGSADNGINNCLETYMLGFDAIIRKYTIRNCTFQTVDGTGGNIAKFGVGLNTIVSGCQFLSSGRTSLSASGAIEFGNVNNNLAATMSFTMHDCIVTDNTSSGLPAQKLAALCKNITFSRCAFNNSVNTSGGGLIYANESVISGVVKIIDCFFHRALIEGTTATNISKIEAVRCKLSYFTYQVAGASMVNEVTLRSCTIDKQISLQPSNLQKLCVLDNTFLIGVNEHYLYAALELLFRGNEMRAGPDAAAATNLIVFYANADISENNIDVGSYRTNYFTYSNSAQLNIYNNNLRKSNDSVIGAISGSYVMYANMVNGYYRDLNRQKLMYGSAAPTSGTFAVGDRVINTAPAASGTIGWACTTAGSPGTWKTYGSIAA